MSINHYYLGCPIWGNKAWVGELFTRDAKAADFLAQYASVFNTVEGNTTFYGIPTDQTVARWRDDTPDTFRFCFKYPRTISHEKRLVNVQAETEHFLNTLSPLLPRLGPYFLQLPPSFGPEALPELDLYLRGLPDSFHYAVEVRHPTFFTDERAKADLNGLLASLGVERVIFDTRPLRAADPSDPLTREAQRKKPDLPVHFTATGTHPFVRFVAHAEVEANLPWLEEWATQLAQWVAEGRTPYFFVHAPDDFYAPRLARIFHRLLRERAPVGTIPPWPVDEENPPLEQLSLF